MSRTLYIFGCGGHARSVADVVISNPDAKIDLVFIDEKAREDEKIYGYKVVSNISDYPVKYSDFFVAIGDNKKRGSMLSKLSDKQIVSIISADATICRDAQIAEGVFIGHEAYIGPLTNIKKGSIVNTRAVIEHEVTLGENSQVAPGVIIGGRVNLGKNTFIGLGARIIDNLSICNDVVVGASAVVVDSITVPGVYVGVPARRVK